MKLLKRLDFLLCIVFLFFFLAATSDASPTRTFAISKRGVDDDNTVQDNHQHTKEPKTTTARHSPTPTASPSASQHRDEGVIKLYSDEWWQTVYGSVYGIPSHMIALGSLLIVIGLYLCLLGVSLWKPTAGIASFLAFGLFTWIALANRRPEDGYPRDTIVMIVVPICVGLVFGGLFFVFWNIGVYFAGALGGLALAIFICTWKSNLLIEHLIGRYVFLGGLALVFAVGMHFSEIVMVFSTSFVGAYIIFLGVDVLARKGYIAGFELILNGNPYNRVEYTVSTVVYVFLAMTLVLFFISFGWQQLGFMARKLKAKIDPPEKKEAPREEPEPTE